MTLNTHCNANLNITALDTDRIFEYTATDTGVST